MTDRYLMEEHARIAKAEAVHLRDRDAGDHAMERAIESRYASTYAAAVPFSSRRY